MLGLRGRTAWQFMIHQASTHRRDTANIQRIQYTELGSIPHPSYIRGDLNTMVAPTDEDHAEGLTYHQAYYPHFAVSQLWNRGCSPATPLTYRGTLPCSLAVAAGIVID